MKLKKKIKLMLIVIIVLAIAAGSVFVIYKVTNKKNAVKETKVLKTIDEYGYELKDNKSKRYTELFKELEKILLENEVDEEAYVKKIAELFIYDFYTLNDKTAKTDVGGVDFVHTAALANFLVNAEDTYYKYVESNLYGERKQALPTVNTMTIESITPTEYVYNNQKASAYEVKISWTYTEEKYSDYQTSAKLTFVKEDIKYYLVELQ